MIRTGLRIGVVGGSISGCSAARQLALAGHEVDVFERSKKGLLSRGGGIGTPTNVFDNLIAKNLTKNSMPRLPISNLSFVVRTDKHPVFGRNAWTLPVDMQVFHWNSLFQEFRSGVPDQNYHHNKHVVNTQILKNKEEEHESVQLLFLDGSKSKNYDLVLFADGYQSLGRTLINPEANLSYRGYYLWRGLLKESEMDLDQVQQALNKTMARVTYSNGLKGTMVVYLVPGRDGSVKPGERLINWAAYRTLEENKLEDFMIDKNGNKRAGAIPPGQMKVEEEERLKAETSPELPSFFGEVVNKTRDTYVQLIYMADVNTYHKNKMCLVGDAGLLIPPFTVSGVLKGHNNIKDLVTHIQNEQQQQQQQQHNANHNVDFYKSLNNWDKEQIEQGKELTALAIHSEGPYIWNMCDISTTPPEKIAEWWGKQIPIKQPINAKK